MKIKMVLTLLALVGIGVVGSFDMEDEIAEEQFYCDQVKGGYWPDYKNIAEKVCNETE